MKGSNSCQVNMRLVLSLIAFSVLSVQHAVATLKSAILANHSGHPFLLYFYHLFNAMFTSPVDIFCYHHFPDSIKFSFSNDLIQHI